MHMPHACLLFVGIIPDPDEVEFVNSLNLNFQIEM